jgi:hypothetical protein
VTLLSVWCCVRYARHATERLADDYNGELWIEIQMPAILPVGSWVDLPTPRAWRSVLGVSIGKISEWSLVGRRGVVVCEIDDPCHLGREQVKELLAIGYSEHFGGYPKEVCEASEDLFR